MSKGEENAMRVLSDLADPEFFQKMEGLVQAGTAKVRMDAQYRNTWYIMIDGAPVVQIDTTPGDEDFETNMEIP